MSEIKLWPCGCPVTADGLHRAGCPYMMPSSEPGASKHGWICPVCGAGLAPSVQRCSCVDKTERAAVPVEVMYRVDMSKAVR